MISETLYEESSEILLIAMVIVIPDRLKTKDNEVLIPLITEHIMDFQNSMGELHNNLILAMKNNPIQVHHIPLI